MKCTKCGTELPEDSLFCINCGTKVEDMKQSDVVEELEQKLQELESSSEVKSQKKHGLLVAGIGVILLAAVVAVVVLLFKLIGSVGGVNKEKMLVYQKDGTIYYMPDMDKDKDPIEIDENRDEDSYRLELTENGKYLYYRSTDDRQTLCRAELGKLKADSSKNEKYITEIDSKVEDYELIDDTRLLYIDTSDRLYYYNGKTEEQIDKNVFNFAAYGNMVYYQTNKGESDRYYYYDLNKKQGDCYAKDILLVGADWTNGTVFAQDKDEIYRIDISGDETKLVDGVDNLIQASVEKQRIYFVKQRKEEHKLYEYVDDTYAESDAAVKEPDSKDYMSKCKEKDVMPKDTYRYYKEYPEEKTYFYDDLDWSDEVGMYYFYNWDNDCEYYYDKEKGQWYLCDTDGLYQAWGDYSSIESRNMLRDELKDHTYSQTFYDLYMWESKGDAVLVAENVDQDNLYISVDAGIVVYDKTKTDEGVQSYVSIDEIDSAYDVEDVLDDGNAMEGQQKANSFVAVGTAEQELDGRVVQMEAAKNGKDLVLFIADKHETIAVCYEITASGLKEIGKLADGIARGSWSGDSFYFVANVSDEGDYGDFMVMKNGKEKLLAKNVAVYSVRCYEDGTVAAFKDNEKKDLRIFDSKGEDQKIASDVSDYTYMNERRILYIKNENLYLYNGKDEDRRLVRGISEIYYNYLCFGKSRLY